MPKDRRHGVQWSAVHRAAGQHRTGRMAATAEPRTAESLVCAVTAAGAALSYGCSSTAAFSTALRKRALHRLGSVPCRKTAACATARRHAPAPSIGCRTGVLHVPGESKIKTQDTSSDASVIAAEVEGIPASCRTPALRGLAPPCAKCGRSKAVGKSWARPAHRKWDRPRDCPQLRGLPGNVARPYLAGAMASPITLSASACCASRHAPTAR